MTEETLSLIKALRSSHDELEVLVEEMGPESLAEQSYDTEWPVSKVLSHLGSGAEIFSLLLYAALEGKEAPGNESFKAIWARWDAMEPEHQAAEAIESDSRLVKRLEALEPASAASLKIEAFGMTLDVETFVRMRLQEHAVHLWDIAVTFSPDATVASEAVNLIVDHLDMLVAHVGKPNPSLDEVIVRTSSPDRELLLQLTGDVRLHHLSSETTTQSSETHGESVQMAMPAEAFLRLIYGRLDPDHTPEIEDPSGCLHKLRASFPGF